MSSNAPSEGLQTDWVTTTTLLNHLRDPADDAAWSQMVGVFRPILVRHAFRHGFTAADAEDIAQQAFAEFARSYAAGGFNAERGRLRDWLFGIARNQMASRRRQLAKASRDGDSRPDSAAADRDGPQRQLWETEWRDALLRLCLERVAREVEPRTYESFLLFAIRGQPAAEVATRLGITENAVFLGKRRILGLMRDYVDQMEIEI